MTASKLWYETLATTYEVISPTPDEIYAQIIEEPDVIPDYNEGAPHGIRLVCVSEDDSMVLTLRLGHTDYLLSPFGVIGWGRGPLAQEKIDKLCDAYAYYIPRVHAQFRAFADLEAAA